MKKRFLGLILAISLTLSSSFTCFASSASYETSEYTTINIEDLENNTLTEEQIAEQKNALTETLKFIIKNLIHHGDEAAKIIEKVSGKKVAKWFLKYHSGIAGALTPLLTYAELPKETVADAIYRGVINAGGTAQIASNIRTAVSAAWDLFLF